MPNNTEFTTGGKDAEQTGWDALSEVKFSGEDDRPDWKTYVDTLSDEQIANFDYDPNRLTRSADDFGVDYDDYPIIRDQAYEKEDINGAPRKVNVNTDEATSLHVSATQHLIDIIDGRHEKYDKPDHIIYLDKSGRPLSWLVNTFWEDMASKDADGNVVERPPHSFVNIDRKRVLSDFFHVGFDGSERPKDYESTRDAWREYKKQLSVEHLAQLRALFLEDGLDPALDPTPEEIMDMPATLDGKKILVVDEVRFEGTTLDMAKMLFEKAFKDAKVQTVDYWPEPASKSAPVWYPNDGSIEGRGIGDINPAYYEAQFKEYPTNITNARRYGSKFYSEPLGLDMERGNLSRQLAKDIETMRDDYRDGKIILNPFLYTDVDMDRGEVLIVRQGINPANFNKIYKEVFSRPLGKPE